MAEDEKQTVWQRWMRIARIGIPIMLGMSVYVILEIVDMLFVGRLGTTALAPVGISAFVSFMFMRFLVASRSACRRRHVA
jgi:Na+-driven multidrug efflux pump